MKKQVILLMVLLLCNFVVFFSDVPVQAVDISGSSAYSNFQLYQSNATINLGSNWTADESKVNGSSVSFTNLVLNGVPSTFAVSASDCILNITKVDLTNELDYTVSGIGTQTFTTSAIPRQIIIDGAIASQENGWTTTPTGFTIYNAQKNVTVYFVNTPVTTPINTPTNTPVTTPVMTGEQTNNNERNENINPTISPSTSPNLLETSVPSETQHPSETTNPPQTTSPYIRTPSETTTSEITPPFGTTTPSVTPTSQVSQQTEPSPEISTPAPPANYSLVLEIVVLIVFGVGIGVKLHQNKGREACTVRQGLAWLDKTISVFEFFCSNILNKQTKET
jgi:hypothetical protein